MTEAANQKVEAGPAAMALKALRERSGWGLRELAEALNMSPNGYRHYEAEYKKAFLPVDFVERLLPKLVGRGNPAIAPEEVSALTGVNQRHRVFLSHSRTDVPWVTLGDAQISEQLPAPVEKGVLVRKLNPEPGDPIYDWNEAALLRMYRSLKTPTKQAAFFDRLDLEMPSLRKAV